MKVSNKVLSVKRDGDRVCVLTDGVEIRVMLLTDSIVRIRAGFDGDFAEESYSLVMTAWEDRMDEFLKNYRKRIKAAEFTFEDGADKAVMQGKL